LVLASAFVLTVAGAVWSIRAQKAALKAEQKQVITRMAELQTTERRQSQHAVSLLIRAFLAERQSTYSALAETKANYAGKSMHSTAKVTRTPTAMAISYISGDRQGLSLGYNQRWMWRQRSGAPMEAYAEMTDEPASVLAKRVTLMLDNYSVSRVRSDAVSGRKVEVLEIRPLRAIDGAKGPGKYLSVDEETGLALQTETFDHQWRSMMKSSLSQIDFSPRITPQTFASLEAMSQAAKRRTWMARDLGSDRQDVARETGWQPPEPKYLPPGFAFDSVGVHHCDPLDGAKTDASGQVAAMSRYTDGLNTLSVFAMAPPSGAGTAPEQVCDFGPGTLISKNDKGGFVIVVADLPEATLHRVAESTTLQKASR
jgi:negative regulator of sigma E activity